MGGFPCRLFREVDKRGGHAVFDAAPGTEKSLPEVGVWDQELGSGVFTVQGVL